MIQDQRTRSEYRANYTRSHSSAAHQRASRAMVYSGMRSQSTTAYHHRRTDPYMIPATALAIPTAETHRAPKPTAFYRSTYSVMHSPNVSAVHHDPLAGLPSANVSLRNGLSMQRTASNPPAPKKKSSVSRKEVSRLNHKLDEVLAKNREMELELITLRREVTMRNTPSLLERTAAPQKKIKKVKKSTTTTTARRPLTDYERETSALRQSANTTARSSHVFSTHMGNPAAPALNKSNKGGYSHSESSVGVSAVTNHNASAAGGAAPSMKTVELMRALQESIQHDQVAKDHRATLEQREIRRQREMVLSEAQIHRDAYEALQSAIHASQLVSERVKQFSDDSEAHSAATGAVSFKQQSLREPRPHRQQQESYNNDYNNDRSSSRYHRSPPRVSSDAEKYTPPPPAPSYSYHQQPPPRSSDQPDRRASSPEFEESQRQYWEQSRKVLADLDARLRQSLLQKSSY